MDIIVISDFIEGQPVVASVRYTGLMKHLKKRFKLTIINDIKYGDFKSEFSTCNYKFISSNKKINFERDSFNIKNNNYKWIYKNKYILSSIRNIKYNKYLFLYRNKQMLRDLIEYIKTIKINKLFVTVPDIYGLYICEYVKKKVPDIKVIIELRDIINHNIGEGYPKLAFKKAEKIINKNADGIIALSEGIYDYYHKRLMSNVKSSLIKNGYNLSDFIDSEYLPINLSKTTINFAHIGSIYEGRNIQDLIKGLSLFGKKIEKVIELNIIGIIDDVGLYDISEISEMDKQGVTINILGAKPHIEAINYLKECDIAVILTHKKGSDYAIPGKTFEYIGACKPIIAVTEDKGLVNLIDGKYGECAKHHADDIFKKLLILIDKQYDFNDRRIYSREKQAEKIISFIESI